MRRIAAMSLLLLFAVVVLAQPAKEAERMAKWEKEVAPIEKRQAEKPPKKGGVVFAGSSTVRMWDVAKAFPDWKVTNSGFGGSQIRDVTHFAERLIVKHEPRAIVFYAGDNDINANRTPEQVLADFRAFVEKIRSGLPKAKVYFIAVKPSPARWAKYEVQKKANALVKEYCEKTEGLAFIDIVPAMLGADGKPPESLFVKDGLHLSPAGYEILNEAVRKAVR